MIRERASMFRSVLVFGVCTMQKHQNKKKKKQYSFHGDNLKSRLSVLFTLVLY
jgi:hypothetical protein